MDNIKSGLRHDHIETQYVFSIKNDVFLTQQEDSNPKKEELIAIPFRWTAL